jgi:hypothetical protein
MDAGRPLRSDQRSSRTWRVLRSASLPLLAAVLLWAPASGAATPAEETATPADRAATLTYLQAGYQLDQAILHNAAASRAAITSFAQQLGEECHGVLAGAPNEESGPPQTPPTPRARGELKRSEEQLQTIDEELSLTSLATFYRPDLAAAEAFAGRIASLSWSDPRIAPLVRFEAERLKQLFMLPAVDVCADMKSWAQSGYHVLSAASREFEATQQASAKAAPAGSINALLKPSEGTSAKALIRRGKTLQAKLTRALASVSRVSSSLERALGVQEAESEAREQEPVLGRGTTRAGSVFVVRREKAAEQPRSSCQRSVSVELEEGGKTATGHFLHGSESSVCLSGRDDHRPSGECSGGVETITAAVPASVRTVRLRLSNGQTITSSTVRIAPRDGGPGAVYVQAVRGYSPYPVSLTELDGNGKVIAVEKVKLRCHKEVAESGPRFVDLATGTTPGGNPFTIQGVLVHFGRHQTSFSLELGVGLHDFEAESGTSQTKPKTFPWSLAMECQPHEFAIIYGILSAPGSSVMARTPAGLVPLTKVELAPNLHSEGPLVYGVFSALPSELVVLGSDGSTLYSESLAAKGKEEAEFCAGYEER